MTDRARESGQGMPATHTRRSYIKWIIAAAVGIPLAVESRTLIGMVSDALAGGSGHEFGEGDQLLPSTASSERVTTLEVHTEGDVRQFRLSAAVTNEGTDPYIVTVTDVHLDDETVLNTPATTGQIQPGETKQLRGEWTLPGETTPVAIDVIGKQVEDGTESVVSARRIDLPDLTA